METKKVVNSRVVFPEYWAKRKHRMKKEFLEELNKAAKSEPVETDEYGEYKIGTFLHRSCIVTVKRDEGVWSLHIYSENPVGLPLIKEIRYKYIPDRVLMAQLFGNREEQDVRP